MSDSLARLRARWNGFFHAEERPDALALIRILLCATLLVGVVQRLPHARLLISADGAATPFDATIAALVPPGGVAVAMYAALAVCLLAGAIGWQTRLALAAAVVLYPLVGFLDAATTLTKYTIIGTHGLLLLAMSPAAAAWSVDARFGSAARDRIPTWPRRLLQLFLCALYFGTAITKIQTPAYHTGEHLIFWMLTDINAAHPLGHWLATQPTLAVIAAETTLIWELLFAVAIWVRPLRRPMLAAGVAFHLGTLAMLGLWLFPFVMLALYPAFAESSRVRATLLAIASRVRLPAVPQLRPAATAGGFAAVLLLSVVTAVEAEYRLDPLDRRHPERRPVATPLDAAAVGDLLDAARPLGPKDWVYRVDLGTTMAAGAMLPHDGVVAADDPLLLQVWVHQPHPDFWLQTDVHRLDAGDSEGVLYEGGVAVLREQRSVVSPFAARDPLPPGAYAAVLKYEGREIWRKRFVVE